MKLRPYQEAACTAIEREWEKGNHKTLLVLPTGCGKTIVFATVARHCVDSGRRVLILAHRGELLEQAASKLENAVNLPSLLEKAESTAAGTSAMVVIGSIQTLARQSRLNRYGPYDFDTIIIDEAHHAASDSYQRILEYFHHADVLGVTATPDRADRKNLGKYFDSLAYEYFLPQAIKDGYLVPIKAQMIPLKLDISGVKVTAGDYAANDLGDALEPYLELIAQHMASTCKGRKTVVFLPLVSTSQKFAAILREYGLSAAEVNGNSPDRAEILADFENGKYDVLCNAMLLTEGWDCPSVDCIAVLRPTKSRALYAQMVGRGTRLADGKTHLLLLDFLWMSERHALCRPASLIAPSVEIAQKMQEALEAKGFGYLDALEAQAEKDVVAEREATLAKQLKEMKSRKKRLVDPLQFELSIQAEDLVNYSPSFASECEPATEKQIKTLEKFGIDAKEDLSKGKATALIDRLITRSRLGLSTAKQIRFLEGKGFRHVGQWAFDAAKNMINRIAANGWIVPNTIDRATYQP